MSKPIKIVIAGIGGVGGYFGGLMAKHFAGSDNVKVFFIARGEHLKQIQSKGLLVKKGADSFTAIPALATDLPGDIGLADYIIICTKTFGLESMIGQLKPCIGHETVLLPLLNGVDSTENIRNLMPDAKVLQGCVYIVSQLKEPGVIENSGNGHSLFFGSDSISDERLLSLESLFKQAGIETTLSGNISSVLWEKFIFISPTATATSYFNSTIGKLMTENEETVTRLIDEVIAIAHAKGVPVDREVKEKVLHRLRSIPYDNTSSMHRDYLNKKQMTELESLTGYVVKAGAELNIPTPVFEKAYLSLKTRTAGITAGTR